jgi:hypothetical protein
MPSVDFSFDFSFESSLELSPESTSKDSRKLFNPRLFSQTRTDISVQFSRSRRRLAAGRRILAEAFIGVKRKRSGTLTLSTFAAYFFCPFPLFPAFAAKDLTPHALRGYRT